jgi:predicted acylesterase/phospholipase RssA
MGSITLPLELRRKTHEAQNQLMAQRLAIVISGAVSLGAYEAGVLYEVLRGLENHNTDPATSPEQRIVIDVLSGASAGGMTAAITSRTLLFNAGALANAYDNPFYNPWVRDIDLLPLLELREGEDPAFSMLSSALIERISRAYLGAPATAHASRSIGTELRLGLAMSNLNGVDYGVQQRDGETFEYTRFQDEFLRKLDHQSRGGDLWDQIRRAAVACGAFPFAFRVQELLRLRSEYGPNFIDPGRPLRFAYADGGIFQNEPLGLAKRLVNEIDRHLNVESRFYLYVSPDTKSSQVTADFTADKATMLKTLGQLIHSIFAQGRFQDWIQTETINDEVALFNKRAWQLKDVLISGAIKPGQLEPAATALLPLLVPEPQQRSDDLARLKSQFAEEYTQLASHFAGPQVADVWLAAIMVLEASAGLRNRDTMTIYTITATPEETGGELLFSFADFFEEKMRRYDYDLGRIKAQAWLNSHANTGGSCRIGPIRFGPLETITLDPRYGSLRIRDLDRHKREQFKERLNDRAMDLLKEAGLPWIVRAGVNQFYLRPKLGKMLEV